MRRSMLAAVVTAATVVAGAAGLVPAAQAASDPTSALPASRTVLLPTGDAVRIATTGGRQQVTVQPAQHGGVTGALQQLTAGGDTYVFPAEVKPFLGRALDPSLFDVTTGSSGRIAVTATAAPGAAVTVPGLAVTSRSGSTVRGYLTPGAAFRAGLVAAWKQATRPGATAPASLFGVSHLAAANATAPAAPNYPQLTLKVKVLDETGAPAAGGLVGIVNVDNTRKYIGFAFFQNGVARVSVPAGNYSGITDVSSFDESSGVFTDRIVPKADFEVTENLQTVVFDARQATVTPSVSTPKPADVASESLEFDRSDDNGGSLGSSFLLDGSSQVFVAPTPRAKVGGLDWLTGWTLLGGTRTAPYSYDLSYLDQGLVPADQAKAIAPFQLATVNTSYYNDTPSDSAFVRTPIYPFQFFVFSVFQPLHTPVKRTEYVFAPADVIWTASLLADPTDENPFGGAFDDDYRIYPSGDTETAEWLHGPLASAPPEQTNGDSFYGCPACRTDGKMFVLVAPVVDTMPGHTGELSDPEQGKATQFALYRDGTKIASGADRIGARVAVPSEAATYRLHLDVDRSADDPKTSTMSSTDLTFRSSAANGAPLPAGWGCGLTGSCRVLTLLKATVPLPTTLSDRMPVGKSTFVMTIAPFRGAGPATITSATFETSVAGGAFAAADVRRVDNNHYRVTITNPAATAGQAVTVRVHATDDAGDAISQTTQNAYLVAAS